MNRVIGQQCKTNKCVINNSIKKKKYNLEGVGWRKLEKFQSFCRLELQKLIKVKRIATFVPPKRVEPPKSFELKPSNLGCPDMCPKPSLHPEICADHTMIQVDTCSFPGTALDNEIYSKQPTWGKILSRVRLSSEYEYSWSCQFAQCFKYILKS